MTTTIPQPPAGGYKLSYLIGKIEAWKAEQELINPHPIKRPRKPRTHAAVDTSTVDLNMVAQAAQALTAIGSERAERYETWVEIGMSLSELGGIGLHLWEQWSKQSAKYDPSACSEKWSSFAAGAGVTISTLLFYAQQAQPDAETGPCRACDAKAQIVNVQREKIADLEVEVKQLRERNRFVSEAQGAKGIKSASLRDTIVELKKEVERVPVEDRKADGFIPVRPAYMAACANSSAPTVNKHLRRLEKQGYIERRIEREYDRDAQTWKAQSYVRLIADLNNPEHLVVPSDHGGYKQLRCINTKCGSINIVDKVERICLDCNTPQDALRYVVVNEVEDETAMGPDGYVEDAPENAVEDAATFFEQAEVSDEGQKNEATPRQFIMTDKSYVPRSTTGLESLIGQDEPLIASLSTLDLPPAHQRPINGILRRPPVMPPREYPPGYGLGLAERLRTLKNPRGEA